jgi:hypothetical protein
MAASRGVLPQGSIHGDTWRPPWIRSICENPGPGVAVRAMYHMSVEARWFGQVDRMEAQGARTAIWGPSMVDWTKVRDISVCLRLLHPISIHLDLVLSGIQSSHLLPPILQIFHGLLGHVRNHLRVSVGGGGGGTTDGDCRSFIQVLKTRWANDGFGARRGGWGGGRFDHPGFVWHRQDGIEEES